MVMEGIQEDIGDGNMQCMNHPYKNSSPGGICAFCLQEKLGKLVSSSFSSSIFPSSSSSSSSISRSDFVSTTTTTSTHQVPTNNKNTTDCTNYHPYDQNNIRKSKIHFLKKSSNGHGSSVNMASSGSDSGIVFKRSQLQPQEIICISWKLMKVKIMVLIEKGSGLFFITHPQSIILPQDHQ